MFSASHSHCNRHTKLSGNTSTTTLYDLSSYILKNDLSQLALGICDVIRNCKDANVDKFPLDRQFSEQGGKTLLHLAVQSSSLAIVHCLVMVSGQSDRLCVVVWALSMLSVNYIIYPVQTIY